MTGHDIDPVPDALGLLQVHQCWALLRMVDLGRLAVVTAGRPEIFPVNFVVDHGSVVFRTAEGTKLAALTITPDVAFEADGQDPNTGEVWSVVIKGRVRELTRLEELLDAESLPLHPAHPSAKNRFVRIEPEHVHGRRFAAVARTVWDSILGGQEHRAGGYE